MCQHRLQYKCGCKSERFQIDSCSGLGHLIDAKHSCDEHFPPDTDNDLQLAKQVMLTTLFLASLLNKRVEYEGFRGRWSNSRNVLELAGHSGRMAVSIPFDELDGEKLGFVGETPILQDQLLILGTLYPLYR